MRRETWELLFALAEEQHGAFTVAQAAELGADGKMLARAQRDGLIDRARARVWIVLALIDDDTSMAALQLAFARAVASHSYAAHKHGHDGVEEMRLDVLVPPNVRLRGPAVHRVTDLVVPEIVMIDGLRCTDEIRTIIDYASVVDDSHVERAVESLLRRRPDALALLRDRAAALARQGKSGPQRVLRMLATRPSCPTGSDLETVYWQCLREHGVELPVRQHPVGPYVLDCAYPDGKLFIELDGWKTHGDRAAFGHDRRRQNEIVLNDWVPLRFTDSDVRRFGRRTARLTDTTLRRRRALLVARLGA